MFPKGGIKRFPIWILQPLIKNPLKGRNFFLPLGHLAKRLPNNLTCRLIHSTGDLCLYEGLELVGHGYVHGNILLNFGIDVNF